ncbi:hypothetical protein [Gallibacterium anatis]|uniref:hypothetical protein n=1 Tax=Gallibacterium anatis TaxID=750 RepID=UPI002550836B|nr:hypothetical protein [Gallibacterium anatis]WIM83243.1 hypothetical protein QP019_06260 [Gallibacterium anatis]
MRSSAWQSVATTFLLLIKATGKKWKIATLNIAKNDALKRQLYINVLSKKYARYKKRAMFKLGRD